MEELIAASDVVITKAGPSTMMECLAMGRFAIITQAVGEQEQGNLPYILKHLDGYCAYQPFIGGMLKTIRTLAKMDTPQPAQAGLKGDGAYQIASIVMEEFTQIPINS